MESCVVNIDGRIAQLVEQRIENPCVPGSNPGAATIIFPYQIFECFLSSLAYYYFSFPLCLAEAMH